MKLLCVPRGYENYISCEFNEVHDFMGDCGWQKLIIDEVGDDVILEIASQSASVLLWEAYEFIDRNEVAIKEKCASAKKFFYCDDVHFFDERRRRQRRRAFEWADTILATYPRQLLAWHECVPAGKVAWMPHAAASCFTPNFSPVHDRVLLSGSRSWAYPFRQFCHLKLTRSRCDVLQHPGYPGYPGDARNLSLSDPSQMHQVGRERYAAVLRRYPGMLVCGSVFNYLVAKVFEAMASGCVVICERASLGEYLTELGFSEGIHYIGTDYFNLISDVDAFIGKFSADRAWWQSMADLSYGKVLREHTTRVRARQMDELCGR